MSVVGTQQKLVWLDCDPGHDDAMAILLAGHNSSLRLLGISTVAGNQSVDKTTQNVLKMLTISGLEHIDVVKGQALPILRPGKICPEIHGNSGLDGTTFPPVSKKPIDKKAVIHMFDVISSQTEKVHLIATAQLTNVALLLVLFPEVKDHIEQIVLMGGAVGIGNTHPAAEFNIECDPEAAKIVFESGLKVVMVPLEVTHTALVTESVLERINALRTPFGSLLVELLLFFKDTYLRVFKFTDPPLHDPCAVAYVINPELFETEHLNVAVETGSSLCVGRTVCDVYRTSGRSPNAHVALKMDVAAFWNLMITAIEAANSVSCMTVTAQPAN